MRGMLLRVAFVYAPYGHQPFQENLRVVDDDFGRLPPLSLLYAAGIAQQAGHDVIVIDAKTGVLTLEQVIARLEEFQPEALAFTLSTYAFRSTVKWMAALRDRFHVPTIAGGINPRLYPVETLANPAIDYCVLHFATRGLPALLKALEEGRDPAGLPEVVAPGPDGQPVIGEIDLSFNPYDELPMPPRHLIDNTIYNSFISQRKNFTVAVTSTGCPFKCTFCAIAPLPLYRNPVDRVLAEIRECVEKFDVHEIDFFDADFFADRARALEICNGITAMGLDLEWSCRTRVDIISPEILDAAAASGCRQMYLGIETPDQKAQELMRKRVHVDRVRGALELMKKKGIRPLGFFMLGVPGETVLSATQTIRYAMDLPLDYAQFSRMIPKPGSGLHKELVKVVGDDPWRRHILGEIDLERLPNIWSRIDEKMVEALTKLAYIAFYYRPGYILKALRRMRSGEELRRSTRTALRMLADLGYFDERARK